MADVSTATSFFPTAKEGFTTTLASTISSGAATVPLNSVSGYNNGDVVALVVDPTSSTAKQVFTGIIDTSGIQVTSVVWTEGTNQSHTSGATVVDYETATAWALQAKGLKVQHNQDGTHASITANSVTTTGNASVGGTLSVTGASTVAGLTATSLTGTIIKNANLATSTGEIGAAWQSFTPSWTNLTTTTGTNSGVYCQIGKTVFVKTKFVFGASSAMGTEPQFTLPVAPNTALLTVSVSQFAGAAVGVHSGTNWAGICVYNTTNSCLVRVQSGDTTSVTQRGITASVPFSWGNLDELHTAFVYEAA